MSRSNDSHQPGSAPSDWRSRVRQAGAPLAPPDTRRRGVARVFKTAFAAGRAAFGEVRESAITELAAADDQVPYALWLHEHHRDNLPAHLSGVAKRSKNPVGVQFRLVGDPAATAAGKFAQHASKQLWERVSVGTANADGSLAESVAGEAPGDSRLGAVVFCDPDDEFQPDLALRIADALWVNPSLDVVFWDHDHAGPGGPAPRFVTEFSPEAMLSANPIGRSFAVRASALAREPLDPTLGDDAYWDLLLRVVSDPSRARRLVRMGQRLARPVADVGPHAGAVVQRELARRGWAAEAVVGPNAVWVRFSPPQWPSVSIVVPSRFNQDLLDRLLPTLAATDYPAFGLTVADNSGRTPAKEAYYAQWTIGGSPIAVRWEDPRAEFNYSAVNNRAVESTDGDVVVLLNDDTEMVDSRWLYELVGWAMQDDIGVVGPQLLDGDGQIQHGGVVMGLRGLAEHLFGGMDPVSDTLLGHTEWIRNTMASTAACVAIRRSVWQAIGGFDERFVLCGSDVVLGLDAVGQGLRNVVTPAVKPLHLESATRGEFNAVDDMFTSYWRYQRWLRGGDPYFSPHLSLRHHVPTLALAQAPSALDQLGPALGRSFDVFEQATSAHENRHFAAMCDLNSHQRELLAARQSGPAIPRGVRSVLWFLPEFDNPFYGGINTALRLADYLARAHGVTNSFCLVAGPNERWYRSAIRAAFPALGDATITFCDGFTSSDDSAVRAAVGPVDAAIATIWHTAHTAAAYTGAARTFYLIQDFEPGFYPNGTMFALAEESYRLGLYGLCNSETMGSLYRDRYDGPGLAFVPAVDRSIFHPPATPLAGRSASPGEPLRVFLYARPGHWRNCWEIASAAIARVKERFGDDVHFVSAGSWARPNDLDLGIEQLGLLDYRATGDLYRTCDLGIALTVSEHPSYLPLELNACGVPVVAFDLPAGYWALEDRVNCRLAGRSITSLADTITDVLSDAEQRRALSAGALARIDGAHSDWDGAFSGIHRYLGDPARG